MNNLAPLNPKVTLLGEVKKLRESLLLLSAYICVNLYEHCLGMMVVRTYMSDLVWSAVQVFWRCMLLYTAAVLHQDRTR